MDNPEYGVEELSGDLGMVRMSLYRKLQSITGHTPTDFYSQHPFETGGTIITKEVSCRLLK